MNKISNPLTAGKVEEGSGSDKQYCVTDTSDR